MPAKVLITGGTGLLGSELACYFSRNYEVIRFGSQDMDIRNMNQVAGRFRELKPDIVLHAAANADVDFCERKRKEVREINVRGTENVATACRDWGALMVFYSTDYVFDGRKKTPYTEDDTPAPVNYYGQTKLEGEKIVIDLLDKYLILRVAWLFAYHKKAFINRVIERGRLQMEQKKRGEPTIPEKIVDDQISCPTYAYDVARQTEMLVEKKIYGRFHCVANGESSRFNLARFIFQQLSWPVDIIPCKSDEYDWIAPRPGYTPLVNNRLKKEGLDIMPEYKLSVMDYLKEFVK